ncbi:MAG: hypothetical protein ABJB66_11145 [Gemmatimonadaceae bacterium]
MFTSLAILAMLKLTAPQQTIDTILVVPEHGRLEVTSARGSVHIATWSRADIRVRVVLPQHDQIEVDRLGSLLSIVAHSERGISKPEVTAISSEKLRIRTVDTLRTALRYEITIPHRLDVTVSGLHTTISVDSADGNIELSNSAGRIEVTGGSGSLRATSLVGSIAVTAFRGGILARTMHGGVSALNTIGNLQASTVLGPLTLNGVEASEVTASTYSGDLTFTGTVPSRARFELSTHTGALKLTLPTLVNTTLDISQSRGQLEMCQVLNESKGPDGSTRRFMLGTGESSIRLDTFSGTIGVCTSRATNRSNEQ